MSVNTYGALNSNVNPNEEFSYGVYQLESQKPEQPFDLKYYGTQYMPVLNWVKTIQTGERTYNPNDEFDKTALDQYKNLVNQQGQSPDFLSPDQIEKQLIKDTVGAIGTQLGANVGSAMFDTTFDILPTGSQTGLTTTEKLTEGLKSGVGFGTKTFTLGDLSDKGFSKFAESKQNLIFNPKIATKETADKLGYGDLFDQAVKSGNAQEIQDGVFAFKPQTTTTKSDAGMKVGDAFATSKQTTDPKMVGGLDKTQQNRYKEIADSGFSSKGQPKERSFGSRFTDRKNIGAGVGARVTSFFVDLIGGDDPETAAKSAVGTGLGTYIGASLGGPIGAIVGGTLGRAIGGRVICNELYRQNLMTKEDVLIDYQYTFKHLSKQHVIGYHTWSINVVQKMRKGKYVKFWKHVAQHRCNEIKYIMGLSNKPDYLGKIYRKIFEPFCYVIGYFNKPKDYSILYTGENNGT